jgi:hypothetical protein
MYFCEICAKTMKDQGMFSRQQTNALRVSQNITLLDCWTGHVAAHIIWASTMVVDMRHAQLHK